MRKITKWITVAVCLSLTLSIFAACGKKSEKKSEKVEKIDYDKCVTLGEYQTISLKKSDIDKEVQSKIDEQLQNDTVYEQLKKGTVADGDTINIYYVGKVDGKEFDGGSCTKETQPDGYDLTIGSKTFIDGFEDALIGKKVGGTYDINVTFPDQYERNAELAGKPAVFTVTINSKQGKANTPKLEDSYVKENITGYDTVKEYKESLRKTAIQEMAWEQVSEASKVNEYPKQKLADIKKRMETSITYYLKQQGTSLEDYMKAQNMTQETFDQQMDESAKQTLGQTLIYEAIAQKEKISVSDKEYQDELDQFITTNGCEDEAAANKLFQSYYGATAEDILKDTILNQKIKEYLVKNVQEQD